MSLCLVGARMGWLQDDDGDTYMANVATALANDDVATYETFLEPKHDNAGECSLTVAVASCLCGRCGGGSSVVVGEPWCRQSTRLQRQRRR